MTSESELARDRFNLEESKARRDHQMRWVEVCAKSLVIVAGIVVAMVSANGNLAASRNQGKVAFELEKVKFESQLILDAIRTGDPDAAAVNLRLLVDTNLIRDDSTRDDIQRFLDTRLPGTGPALPATGGTARMTASPYPPFELSSNEEHCDGSLAWGTPDSTSTVICRRGYAFGFDSSRRLAR